ncbi:21 kDa seed protein-like [Coffea eugenioides]|uniref:21 kDa seed protein-like n=1 Tax=Coffea eugenioides TaxID=49369 RepID=UPI000F612D8A|nr:21 kDa seed protein-like [Coffea eugenioides]XP_027155872.1 21 kDa seed protein-like [Coffea eugenioides]XP_027164597.1 21 kDa seed protein-like [Coffea eugenioides]
MKKLLLFLSFLLFNSFLSFAVEEPNPVLDTNGDEIRPGVEYYMGTTFRPGGGVTYGKGPGNEICPLAVAQAWLKRGLPVTFTPVNPEEGVVRVSTDLNIKFAEPPIIDFCSGSNVWKVHFNEALEQHFVLTDGVEGNSGCETMANWFKIEAVGVQGYKLVFCPTVCDSSSEAICKYVGIYHDDDGTRRLALGGQPYPVVFIKKNEDILKSVTST